MSSFSYNRRRLNGSIASKTSSVSPRPFMKSRSLATALNRSYSRHQIRSFDAKCASQSLQRLQRGRDLALFHQIDVLAGDADLGCQLSLRPAKDEAPRGDRSGYVGG